MNLQKFCSQISSGIAQFSTKCHKHYRPSVSFFITGIKGQLSGLSFVELVSFFSSGFGSFFCIHRVTCVTNLYVRFITTKKTCTKKIFHLKEMDKTWRVCYQWGLPRLVLKMIWKAGKSKWFTIFIIIQTSQSQNRSLTRKAGLVQVSACWLEFRITPVSLHPSLSWFTKG